MLHHRHRRDRRDQQRAAVGRGVLDRNDADAAGGAGAVVHDDRTAERGGELVADQARQRIAGAAGREREHDPDGLVLRLRERRRGEHGGKSRETGTAADLHRCLQPGLSGCAATGAIVAVSGRPGRPGLRVGTLAVSQA